MDQIDIEKLQQWAQANPGTLLLLAAVLVAVILGIAALTRRRDRTLAPDVEHEPVYIPPPPPEPLLPRQIATMREEIVFTGGGAFCLVLLVITLLVAFAGYVSAKTVFQQIEAGLQAVCGILLWGGGAALGRRRSYVIYNVPAPAERSEPRF